MGNKSPSNPPNSYKRLIISLIFLGVGKAVSYSFSNTGFRETRTLPDQITPQILWWFLGLEFFMSSPPIFFFLTDVSAKSAESCSWANSSHVTLYHQLMDPLYRRDKEEQGQVIDYHPMTYCGAEQLVLGSTWKNHYCPSHMKANWP